MERNLSDSSGQQMLMGQLPAGVQLFQSISTYILWRAVCTHSISSMSVDIDYCLHTHRINGVASQNSYTRYPDSKPCHACKRSHSEIREMRDDACNDSTPLPKSANFDHCKPMIAFIMLYLRWVDWPLHGTKNVCLQLLLGFLGLWKSLMGETSMKELKDRCLLATGRPIESKGVSLLQSISIRTVDID